jgi:release factor glutamine methyltransferase
MNLEMGLEQAPNDGRSDAIDAAGMRHTPRMSAERAERIRQWHDAAYEAAKSDGAQERGFDYLGITVTIPNGVQPITGTSHMLGEAVLAEVRAEDRVLDMGTGSGVNAILAASTASYVLAVDVSPNAVGAAQENAERNGVADRIEVRVSDIFSAVDGEFDLIVFDPPFRWFKPRDEIEANTTDENYRAMTAFFEQAREHLSSRGRMLIFFGSSGDLGYLRYLFDTHGFTAEVVARDGFVKDDWPVEYLTFRLTP